MLSIMHHHIQRRQVVVKRACSEQPVHQHRIPPPFRSLLVMLIRGEPWSPADHQHYPPAFQAAVRTLLLAHRRHGIALPRRSTRGAARKAAAESQVGGRCWCMPMQSASSCSHPGFNWPSPASS